MADRVSASIALGGDLPSSLLADLAAVIAGEGLSTEWDGEDFDLSQIPLDGPLELMAREVAWGSFDELESFCRDNGLAYARWSEACPGSWGANRSVFTGEGEPASYAADDDDRLVIERETIEKLGTFAAILAHFDAADFPIPPLRIGTVDPTSAPDASPAEPPSLKSTLRAVM
jgi:hypothetical protein